MVVDRSSIGKESSRVEYMAQKQNRIFQHLLDDKIKDIEKDFTLTKLAHRMFMKQLKYDMALLKRSTGHSRVARPPTGEHDQRCHTRRAAWRLPELSRGDMEPQTSQRLPSVSQDQSQQLPQLVSKRHTESNSATEREVQEDNSSHLPDVTKSEPAFFLTQEKAIANQSNGATTNQDSVAERQSADGLSSPDESEIDQKIVKTEIGAHNEMLSLSMSSTKSALMTARLQEAKRIINMPTVFQTSQLRSSQNLRARNRVLPPIAVVAAATQDSQDNDGQECTDTKDAFSQLSPGEIRVHFTPDGLHYPKSDKTQKRKDIDEILQESLKRAAEQRKKEKRKQQRQKIKKNLAIERPEGLFRPDNVKLIHKTFKREELFNQHKQLMEENMERKNLPLPAVAGAARLQGKLQAFFDKPAINS